MKRTANTHSAFLRALPPGTPRILMSDNGSANRTRIKGATERAQVEVERRMARLQKTD